MKNENLIQNILNEGKECVVPGWDGEEDTKPLTQKQIDWAVDFAKTIPEKYPMPEYAHFDSEGYMNIEWIFYDTPETKQTRFLLGVGDTDCYYVYVDKHYDKSGNGSMPNNTFSKEAEKIFDSIIEEYMDTLTPIEIAEWRMKS